MEIAAEFAFPIIYHSNHKGTQAFGKSKITSKLLRILLETNLFLVKISLEEPWLPASKLRSKRSCRKTSPMGQKILHCRLCWSLSRYSELSSVYSMVSPGGRIGKLACFFALVLESCIWYMTVLRSITPRKCCIAFLMSLLIWHHLFVVLCDAGYYKISIGVFGEKYQINAYFAFNGLICRWLFKTSSYFVLSY